MKVTLLRHGKTKANVEGRYLGKTDMPLSEEGKRELRRMYPEKLPAKVLFLSPMRRCVESAEIIFGEVPHVLILPEWTEMDFGDFEMKNYRELGDNPDYQAWVDSGGTLPFPNGENMSGYIERVMKGFEIFCRKCTDECIEEASVMVHGGTVMALLSSLTKEEYFSFQTKNGHGYAFDLDLETLKVSNLRSI